MTADETHLPTEYALHPFEVGLNSPTLVAYEREAFPNQTDNVLGTDDDSKSRSREYVRLVRLHTALGMEELTIVTQSSPFYHESFEDMEMGEERRL